MDPKIYRGRFAPSPTGALHFGSLIAAMGSYAEARSQGGFWFLRIDDIDPPRIAPGANDAIPRILEAFGFEWDGSIRYQRQNYEIYSQALRCLDEQDLLFGCHCSRSHLASQSHLGAFGPVYPGNCRHLNLGLQERFAWRIRVPHAQITFTDLIQGPQAFDPARDFGDFVLRRRDGLFAYHLASAVDDAAEHISEVIRGADLLSATAQQLIIQQALNLTSPQYGHLPVAVNNQGQKLSKQTHAEPLDATRPVPQLLAAWRFLGQSPPPQLPGSSTDFWRWAFTEWRLDKVPRQPQQYQPAEFTA